MINGDKKGKKYMRDLCRALSGWIEPDKRGWYDSKKCLQADLPVRVRSTALMPIDGHWDNKGDFVVRPDIAFPYTVEAKKEERWSLDGFTNEKWVVWKWWRQCTSQAEKNKSQPLLLFTRNRAPNYVLCTPGPVLLHEIRVNSIDPVLQILTATPLRAPVVLTTLRNLIRAPCIL